MKSLNTKLRNKIVIIVYDNVIHLQLRTYDISKNVNYLHT